MSADVPRETSPRRYTHKELMQVRDAGQKKIDAICREVQRLQGGYDEIINKHGEVYLVMRTELLGQMLGLRKALCLFFGWDFTEADAEGRADEYVKAWTDVPRET